MCAWPDFAIKTYGVGRRFGPNWAVHDLTLAVPFGSVYGFLGLNGAGKTTTIRMIMGGRAAEDVVFNEFTSGASNDLKRATQLAHKMVCEWGMSNLGPLTLGGGDEEVFLGRDFARMRDFSEETSSAVDREIHRICEEAYKDAREMLHRHEAVLRALAEALIERETLDLHEIDEIIRTVGGPELLPQRAAEPENTADGQEPEELTAAASEQAPPDKEPSAPVLDPETAPGPA